MAEIAKVNYQKKIVCLAASRKPGGQCIAGKEVVAGGYGPWIRPVSVRPSAEIQVSERRYENGTEPQLLDIITIPMLAPVPRLHQTENHMIDDRFYWQKKGFDYNNVHYNFRVTDPVVEKTFYARDNGTYQIEQEAYFCVSLAETAYQGHCYKLVASILTYEPL